VDEFKLAKLFGSRDDSGRFGKAIEKARAYIEDPLYDEASRARVRGLLDRLEGVRSVASDARELSSNRYKGGPTSPAVDAKAYLLNRANLPPEAIGAPGNFLASSAQFMREYGVRNYGKPYAELSSPQKLGLQRFYLWSKNNPNASAREVLAAQTKLLVPK